MYTVGAQGDGAEQRTSCCSTADGYGRYEHSDKTKQPSTRCREPLATFFKKIHMAWTGNSARCESTISLY